MTFFWHAVVESTQRFVHIYPSAGKNQGGYVRFQRSSLQEVACLTEEHSAFCLALRLPGVQTTHPGASPPELEAQRQRTDLGSRSDQCGSQCFPDPRPGHG